MSTPTSDDTAGGHDALDRLAALLERQLVAGGSRTCTVQALVQQHVPYRRWRDVLNLETAEDYEHLVLRLLSGERGYVEVPAPMRSRLADELLEVTPDISLYRAYLGEWVTLRVAPRVSLTVAPPATSRPIPPPLPLPDPDVPVPAPTIMAEELDGRCRYCGKGLPAGRALVFCPHCGQNLTVHRCPACSTELELGWKFCITCGRGLASG